MLRHDPGSIGLELDSNGYANTHELIERARAAGVHLDMDRLRHIVATNSKKRFALSDDESRIRASQGHSIDVDLALEPVVPPQTLYHGTAEKKLAVIMQEGLRPMSRQHVHVSGDTETAHKVGSRHGRPVILEIRALDMHNDGLVWYRSANGVWLTDRVPVVYLSPRK